MCFESLGHESLGSELRPKVRSSTRKALCRRAGESNLYSPSVALRAPTAPGAAETQPASEHQSASDGALLTERAIRCARCAADITRSSFAISLAGHHTHVFINPDGTAFDIACYREAPGCVEAGVPETHWSWFPGYAWRHAFCRTCGAQLGWAYSGEAGAFVGLIRARVRE